MEVLYILELPDETCVGAVGFLGAMVTLYDRDGQPYVVDQPGG